MERFVSSMNGIFAVLIIASIIFVVVVGHLCR